MNPNHISKWNPKSRYSGGVNDKLNKLTEDKNQIKQSKVNTQTTQATNLSMSQQVQKNLMQGDSDVGKAARMIQTGKHLWAMAKGAKAATAASGAGAAGAAALGPVGIAAAVGLAILSKKGKKPAKPHLAYQGIAPEEYWI